MKYFLSAKLTCPPFSSFQNIDVLCAFVYDDVSIKPNPAS